LGPELLTKGGFDDVNNSLAGVDVRNDLSLAEGVFGSFLEDHNLRVLNQINRES